MEPHALSPLRLRGGEREQDRDLPGPTWDKWTGRHRLEAKDSEARRTNQNR